MKKHIIALGGLPGSGKTTVRKILSDKLGYKTFSTGGYVREMAYNRQMSLGDFNKLMLQDTSFDLSVDEKLKNINEHENNYIVDAHLAFHFITNGFSVYLKIDPETAAKRIFNDAHSDARIKSGEVMGSFEEALEHTHWRIQNNINRYERLYGLNPYLEEQYQFSIEADKYTPEIIAEKIIEAYNEWLDV